jgi:cysteinyl-tRNA synthetase
MLKIYNTLTRKKEVFTPIKENIVGIYGCGITPYKESHLGHAMQGIVFDIIRRYLEYKGYDVMYVRNYTDIDDKIIEIAKEKGIHPLEHAENIMRQAKNDFRKLRIKSADIEPKVSGHISEIIKIIEILIKKNLAYITEKGNVYYAIRKFQKYGQLSGQKLDELKVGTRKEVENDKRDALDFALWKSEDPEMNLWNSPWGHGRPGWHIECSAMSSKYLGTHFDIHGGGKDLIFPHHENEIAQSVGAFGEFVNFWVHNGLLMVGKEKMSKSLSNDTSISDWLQKYHPEVIRYLIISNHYRSNIQFNPKRYEDSNRNVYEIYKILLEAQTLVSQEDQSVAMDEKLLKEIINNFEKNMDNDFNTPEVISQIHILSTKLRSAIEKSDIQRIKPIVKGIKQIGSVIGLFDLDPEKVNQEIMDIQIRKLDLDPVSVNKKIAERNDLRRSKKYEAADMIREELENIGVEILDNGEKTEWRVRL